MTPSFKTLAIGAGAFACVFAASPALAQEDAYTPPADELAAAMKIIEAQFPADSREQMLLDMGTTIGNQAASALMNDPIFDDPGIRAIMDEFLADLPEILRPALVAHLPNMINATAIAYTREFTLEELQDISAFAATHSGSRYFSNVQNLLNDPAVTAVNQEFFNQIAAVQQAESAKIQTMVQEYLRANPEVLERLRENGAR